MSEAGIIDSGAIGIIDSVIEYVGPAKTSYDSLARVIDLQGQVITPGFIDLHSTLGANWDDIQQSYNAVASRHVQFSESQVEDLLGAGIVAVALRPPEDSLFGGFSSLVEVLPDSFGGPVVLKDSLDYQISLLSSDWEIPGPVKSEPYDDMENLFRLREALRQLDNPAYAGIDFTPLDANETIVKAVQKGIPLYFLTDDKWHFHIVNELLSQHQIPYYFGEGRELIEYIQYLTSDRLKQLPGIIFGPSSYGYDEANLRYYSMPSELVEYGLDFTLASFAPINRPRALITQTRQLLQYGVTGQKALSSITATPARYVKMSTQLGSLQKGAKATFLVFTDNPMHMTSQLRMTYVKGLRVWQQK